MLPRHESTTKTLRAQWHLSAIEAQLEGLLHCKTAYASLQSTQYARCLNPSGKQPNFHQLIKKRPTCMLHFIQAVN